jgi:shikimate dehydrogenase
VTRLFAVIGSPVSHSLSPAMHTAALRALKLDGRYVACEVQPRFLRPMLEALILAGVEGLNVTVPLKTEILPLMDRLDRSAEEVRAVNTVVVRGRITIGHNTDGIGFSRAVRELGWRESRPRVLLLGAGGAALAVAWELARTPGVRMTIANRTLAHATQLAARLRRRRPTLRVEAVRLKQAKPGDADLVINATSLGMRPGDPSPVDARLLRPGTFVYDLIYHRDTALVQAAKRRDCVAAGGLSMLLYQGAASLQLWTGRAAPMSAMRRGAMSALGRRSSQPAKAV